MVALEHLLAALVDGRGPAALLLLGEAGIGKTTLLRRAGTPAEAHGYRALRAAPARAEQGLALPPSPPASSSRSAAPASSRSRCRSS